MALADFTAYRVARATPHQVLDFSKTVLSDASIGWTSTWTGTGAPGAGSAPGAAAIPTNATAGALGQRDPLGSLYAWVGRAEVGTPGLTLPFAALLVDRLAHMGGLDGTSLIAQAVATPALTRSTDGVGVIAALEIYTTIGSTGQTATMIYNDAALGAAQTSQPVAVGGTGLKSVTRVLPMSLKTGGTGVLDVTSVLLSGSTGTAGNFGVTLYKPLLMFNAGWGTAERGGKTDPVADTGFWFAPVPAGACLQWLFFSTGVATTTFSGTLNFTEF